MAPKDPPADPDRYDEAVAAFRRRLNLSDVEFADIVAQEEARASVAAAMLQGRLVQQAIDGLERAIADGTTLEEFERDAGEALAEKWGGADPARMESLFRTTVMQAYNDGRADIFADPDVRKARPYLRFDAVGDARTSDICDALDGTLLPADDPFWRTHSPPLHPNCRSILTPLTEEEAGEEGVTVGKPDTGDAEPAEGFGERVDPENWEPDLSSFDPAVRDVVGERIKN
jgi:SPP1 gp7 family putative phage head morphogenesis protein